MNQYGHHASIYLTTSFTIITIHHSNITLIFLMISFYTLQHSHSLPLVLVTVGTFIPNVSVKSQGYEDAGFSYLFCLDDITFNVLQSMRHILLRWQYIASPRKRGLLGHPANPANHHRRIQPAPVNTRTSRRCYIPLWSGLSYANWLYFWCFEDADDLIIIDAGTSQ